MPNYNEPQYEPPQNQINIARINEAARNKHMSYGQFVAAAESEEIEAALREPTLIEELRSRQYGKV